MNYVEKTGVNGILKVKWPGPDPEQVIDINGLPDPMLIDFFIHIANGFNQNIFCDAIMVSAPTGWTDAAANLTRFNKPATSGWAVWYPGFDAYTFKSGSTRGKSGVAGTNDSFLLRIRAYSDSGYLSQIDQLDVPLTVYYEDFSTGTQDALYDFDDGTVQGWSYTQVNLQTGSVSGGIAVGNICRSDPYALFMTAGDEVADTAYISRSVAVASGVRAAMTACFRVRSSGIAGTSPTVPTFEAQPKNPNVEIETPVATTDFLVGANTSKITWTKVGMRVNPDASNTIKIHVKELFPHGVNVTLPSKALSGASIIIDDIEVRHW